MIPDADAGESGEPRRWGLPDLLSVLNLERIDADLYRSQAAGEPGHRLFGGQVAARGVVYGWTGCRTAGPSAGGR